MPAISPPHFRAVLAGMLERSGRAPLYLDVIRTGKRPVVVRVTWTDDDGRHELDLLEAKVIARGGPVWVADLMAAKPGKRREMLAA